jgi:hypothetical protein
MDARRQAICFSLRRVLIFAAILSVIHLLPAVPVLIAAPQSAASAVANPAAASRENDQVDLSVTVYNSNLALVKDVRQVQLPAGQAPLRFEDVASSINPATVHFRSLSEPTKVGVLEQNYEYDLLNPQKLLQKYVGKEVTLVRQEQENNSTKYTETKAILLADNDGPVWKIGDEIVTGLKTDSYRFADLPANLYSRPTLVWLLDNSGGHSQKVEASYLTADVNWKADYVLTVARDEKLADLDGWVTLDNKSGVAFHNAQLQLVAGEVHRTPQPSPMMMRANGTVLGGVATKQFAQEAFGEYHLYTLDRRTSTENNESKQISLLGAKSFPVAKIYRVDSQDNYSQADAGEPEKPPVKVFFKFRNDAKSDLGIPLPAGTVRVYQADSAGRLQFAGEDNISHTPKDEDISIYTGNAFDIVCERRQTDYKVIARRVSEAEWQITLRNHKETPVIVEAREAVGGDWEIINSNFKATKLDVNTLSFSIPVEAGSTATLTYRLRVTWQ